MLRRKLLTRIGLLIAALVAGAAMAIWQMQRVLDDLYRVNSDTAFLMGELLTIGERVRDVERLGTGDAGRALELEVERLGRHGAVGPGGPARAEFEGVRAGLPALLAAGGGAESAAAGLELRTRIGVLGDRIRSIVVAEQVRTGRAFRTMVIGLTLASLIMLNVAMVVLLWTAQMVLRPVGALVEGSRQLAAERFEHRVTVGEGDEFGELARAYNLLASQLQANEERKAETLRQLAVTLNHDLNNAMAIIEMQLEMLGREQRASSAPLREIRAVLGRMAGIVASLKSIRRVVLTDYAPGQKMLDLARSVEPAPDEKGGGV
ncbi:MAG: HAMP domain-containing protein [Leptolyngbya sp. PLA1]|nr:HAMP domain-containing protein [Leptolyngbya sp. PLA1]